MLRMIIVDDEKPIREAIKNIIDWEALEIEIIGLCKNGLQAYDMILDEYPDIVLTDIQMPGLSGLELIERVAKISTDTQFVILSGYDNFEYAKKAMQFGINHYLLKPCNEEEIIEVLLKVKSLCLQNKMKKQYKSQNVQMLKILHESAMKDLFQQLNQNEEDFENVCEIYKPFINFESLSYTICKMQAIEKTKEMRKEFISFHNNRASSIPVFYFYVDKNLYLTFENYDFEYEKLDLIFEQDEIYTRQNFKSLQELFKDLRKKLRLTSNIRLLDSKNFVNLPDNIKSETYVVDFFSQNIIQYVRENLNDPELSLKKIAESVLYMNVDYVSKKFVKGSGQKFSIFLANERIECAKAMLLVPNCTIQSVAKAVGCENSPDYFSKLFKKHTGISPSDYIKSKQRN